MKKQILEKEICSHLFFNLQDTVIVLQYVSEDDFSEYRQHFTTIVDSWKNGKNLNAEWSVQKLSFSDMTDAQLWNKRSLEKACVELRELTVHSTISTILQTAGRNVPSQEIDGFVAELQQKLTRTISTASHESTGVEALVAEFTEYQKIFEEKKKQGIKLLGLSTGYEKLDDAIDGLRKGHLWVIGGYTNLGKTNASLNILTHLLKQGKRTVFYSLEMSRVDIISRILGILLGENGTSIAKGYVDAQKVQKGLETIEKSSLGIHNTKTELSQILLSMYEETLRQKPELFIVDFLQLVTVKGTRTEYEATTEAILELQKAAKRFDVPIIVLSQVSNDGARQGDQQVMGFKGSGHIASAADLAIELVSGEESVKELREKMNDGKPVWIKWHIKKNRHGRVGSMTMEFTGRTGVFKEIILQDL